MTNRRKQLVAWDSCVVLDAVQKDKNWWPHIEPMYADAEAGKLQILVSAVTIAEACKGEACEESPSPEAVRKLNDFFENSFVIVRPADDRVARLAAEFIRSHSIRTCDALIAATACLYKAPTLYTRDGLEQSGKKAKLLRLSGKLRDGEADPLKICAPTSARTPASSV